MCVHINAFAHTHENALGVSVCMHVSSSERVGVSAVGKVLPPTVLLTSFSVKKTFWKMLIPTWILELLLRELLVSRRVNSQVIQSVWRQPDKFTQALTFLGTAELCWSGSKQPAAWEDGGLTAGRAVLRVRGMIVQSDQLCGGEGLEALTCTQHM